MPLGDLEPELRRLLQATLRLHPDLLDIMLMIEEGRTEANVYEDSYQVDRNAHYDPRREMDDEQ